MSEYWRVFLTAMIGAGCCIPLIVMASVVQQYFQGAFDDWGDFFTAIAAFLFPAALLSCGVAWIAVLW